MIQVGDKFVIEIGDIFEHDNEILYRIKGFNSLVFDENGMKKLVPIEEATNVNEVWELTKFLNNTKYEDIKNIFDLPDDANNPIGLILDSSVNNMIYKYKDWKKNKSEKISVGDIVKRKSGDTAVVIGINDVFVKCLTSDGMSASWLKSDCIKTERHIDIESILKQIKE